MPPRSSLPPPFDLRRHLSQLVRQVLPLFVIVLALGFIVTLVLNPKAGVRDAPVERLPARVGLLPVDDSGQGVPFDPAFAIPRPLELARVPLAARFDLPLGSPSGAFTYNAQPFLTSRHLGDDLNGIGGRDSDRGDPVHAAADGLVAFSGWAGDGWGHVVLILHRLISGESVATLYGHLERVRLPVGATVRRGESIGTVGKADGRYLAHLHFEVRQAGSLDPGAGYGETAQGRRAGESFIAGNRGAPEDRQNGPVGGDWDTGLPKATDAGPEGGTRIRIATEPIPEEKPVPQPR